MATTCACGAFAAACGSSSATAITIGIVSLPEMKRRNYADSLALGSVVGGGTLGILIPPSIPMIIYAIAVQESVGQLFMGGVFPVYSLASFTKG